MDNEGINPVDVHVGARLRMGRKARDLTQEALGRAMGGITFQQIQKYERGTNRISASKLVQACRALKLDVGYFFEGLPDLPERNPEASATAVGMEMLLQRAVELVPEVLLISDLPTPARRSVRSLLQVLSDLTAPDGDDECAARDFLAGVSADRPAAEA